MHEEIWSDLACPTVLAHNAFGNECSFWGNSIRMVLPYADVDVS